MEYSGEIRQGNLDDLRSLSRWNVVFGCAERTSEAVLDTTKQTTRYRLFAEDIASEGGVPLDKKGERLLHRIDCPHCGREIRVNVALVDLRLIEVGAYTTALGRWIRTNLTIAAVAVAVASVIALAVLMIFPDDQSHGSLVLAVVSFLLGASLAALCAAQIAKLFGKPAALVPAGWVSTSGAGDPTPTKCIRRVSVDLEDFIGRSVEFQSSLLSSRSTYEMHAISSGTSFVSSRGLDETLAIRNIRFPGVSMWLN